VHFRRGSIELGLPLRCHRACLLNFRRSAMSYRLVMASGRLQVCVFTARRDESGQYHNDKGDGQQLQIGFDRCTPLSDGFKYAILPPRHPYPLMQVSKPVDPLYQICARKTLIAVGIVAGAGYDVKGWSGTALWGWPWSWRKHLANT
jgi:hypothetical protein